MYFQHTGHLVRIIINYSGLFFSTLLPGVIDRGPASLPGPGGESYFMYNHTSCILNSYFGGVQWHHRWTDKVKVGM